MKKYLFLLLSFLLVALLVPTQLFAEGITDEEYLVYSAALSDFKENNKPTMFVIKDTTTGKEEMGPSSVKYFEENSLYASMMQYDVELDQGMIDDYNRKNAKEYPLAKNISVSQKIILVSEEDMDYIFWGGGGGWDEFYSRYPGSTGTITLSRVGFNSSGDMAFMYMGNQSHYKAGAGLLMLFAKEDGKWVSVDFVSIWVS